MAISKFQQIREIVTKFQQKADSLFVEYNTKLDRAKSRYSTEVYTQKSREIWSEVGGHLEAERAVARNGVALTVEEIKKSFDEWLLAPVNGDLLQTLNCVRNFEIPLGMAELKTLEKATNSSFFGKKIFVEIAKENGYYLKSPDAQTFMNLLHRVENNATNAVQAYAGHYPDFVGKDLLPEWEYNGQSFGEVPVYLFVAAGQFLVKDTSLKQADELWGQSSIPAEYKLTPDEEKRIYSMIENIEDETAKKERLKELEAIEPDIKNKLPLLSDQYKKAVEGYIADGDLAYVGENGEGYEYP